MNYTNELSWTLIVRHPWNRKKVKVSHMLLVNLDLIVAVLWQFHSAAQIYVKLLQHLALSLQFSVSRSYLKPWKLVCVFSYSFLHFNQCMSWWKSFIHMTLFCTIHLLCGMFDLTNYTLGIWHWCLPLVKIQFITNYQNILTWVNMNIKRNNLVKLTFSEGFEFDLEMPYVLLINLAS